MIARRATLLMLLVFGLSVLAGAAFLTPVVYAGQTGGEAGMNDLPRWQATGTPVPAAPTLVVPTPVPPLVGGQLVGPTVSALERIRTDGVLRVGVLYNNPPMSSLSERGLVEGYEADLARAIAEDWDVELSFVQVTRQNARSMLISGEVDLLMASIVHQQVYESDMTFSQPYFASGQMALVRDESDIQNIAGLDGRRVGVVQGTASEYVLGQALSTGRLNVTPQLYLTLNRAVGGLGSGEVDAVIADRIQLLSVLGTMTNLRVVDQHLVFEPLAVAMRRYDESLRYLVDRSLQRVFENDTLDDLRRKWFPSVAFSHTIPVWEGVEDDGRTLGDLDASLGSGAGSVVERIRAGGAVRIVGFMDGTPGAGLDSQMDGFYRALATEVGQRWGVPVEILTGTQANAVELVASGLADLALGAVPRWDGPFEVAYTSPIVMHGDRMMVPANSDIAGFNDLRGGRWVGIFASEPGTADRVNELAESVNSAVNIFTIINDADAVFSLTVEKNIDVVFGDSLRLIPQVNANADLVELTDRWYSTEYYTLAVPRRDADFWSLVELTLQAMIQDGTFAQLWVQHVNAGEVVAVDAWPGPGDHFLGVNLLAR